MASAMRVGDCTSGSATDAAYLPLRSGGMKISRTVPVAAVTAALLLSGCGSGDTASGTAGGSAPQASNVEAQLKDAYQHAEVARLEPGFCFVLPAGWRGTGTNAVTEHDADPKNASRDGEGFCLLDGKLVTRQDVAVSTGFYKKLPLRADCKGDYEGVNPPGTEDGQAVQYGGFLCVADDGGSSVVYVEKPDDRGVVVVRHAQLSSLDQPGG